MPPFPRPASPLSLEIYSPTADDIESDGVLGSDDEEDESSRRVRRQRIEKLAETYLQGNPLFILSASLKGPFEDGWVNPWRKTREQKPSENVVEESVGPVVQETERRYPRHVYESREQSEAYSERQTGTGQKKAQRSGNGVSRVRSVQGTPKRTAAWVKDTQLGSQLRDSSIAKPTRDDWLKRDNRRPAFRGVNLPTSPTTTLSARLLEARNRSMQPDSARPQSSRRLQSAAPISNHHSPVKAAAESKPSYSLAGEVEATRRSDPIVDCKPLSARASPSKHLSVPPPAARRASSRGPGPDGSFCVVSSSSQLPKFEYRRRKSRNSGERRSALYEIPIRSQSENSQDIGQIDQQEASPKPTAPKKSLNPSKQHDQAQNEQHVWNPVLSNAGSIIDSRYGSRMNQGESRTTHGTTSYSLPSAQPVPPFPTMTDQIPSLHSTALPTNNSGDNGNATGSDPGLSTQAAFHHAQKTFQDDLASDEEDSQHQEAHTISSRKRRHSQSSVWDNSHKITPFRRLNGQMLHGNGTLPRAAAAALPSTQHLVEAITPFSFSTDRKRHAHFGTRSGTKSSSKKPKTASSAQPSPSPVSSRSESAEPDWRKSYDSPSRILSSTRKLESRESPSSHSSRRTAWSQSSGFLLDNGNLGGGRQPSPEHGIEASPEQRPKSPNTAALPLTVTGPSASQDGQGGVTGESFNLSQAIADAGSWLQDSFDLKKNLQ